MRIRGGGSNHFAQGVSPVHATAEFQDAPHIGATRLTPIALPKKKPWNASMVVNAGACLAGSALSIDEIGAAMGTHDRNWKGRDWTNFHQALTYSTRHTV